MTPICDGSLRAALDEVPQGIVLLDSGLRAQFINRALRAMWHLPGPLADSTPTFATLLHHRSGAHAYELPDAYIEHCLAQVRLGDPDPVDLHLTSGNVIRCQCTKLPDGGRMLSYTDVTELVRRADNLERLRSALDNIDHGVILLDRDLNVEFMNTAVRRLWQLPDRRPDDKVAFVDLGRTCAPKPSLGHVWGSP
jgi:PAS domain-containing protein